jgi:hypothetical protein
VLPSSQQQTIGSVDNENASNKSHQQILDPSGGEERNNNNNNLQSVQNLIPPSLRHILTSQPTWAQKMGIGVMSMVVLLSFI